MPMQITLYTKPDCPLCEHLQNDLAWVQREVDFTVALQDINSDPALFAQFQYLIPVLEIAGVLYYPPHDLLQLRQRLLDAARANAAS
jgi:hypothetical protein